MIENIIGFNGDIGGGDGGRDLEDDEIMPYNDPNGFLLP